MNAENPLQKALPIAVEKTEDFKVDLARLNSVLADGWRVVEATQLGQGALIVVEKQVSTQEIEHHRRISERRLEAFEDGAGEPIVTPPPDQSAA